MPLLTLTPKAMASHLRRHHRLIRVLESEPLDLDHKVRIDFHIRAVERLAMLLNNSDRCYVCARELTIDNTDGECGSPECRSLLEGK